ncbi:hypothetical protein [Euzebya tangerina]|uniref:hypothetical protein n=1 Tax=Euzebya tangerina TaxID=591198 RepID=UPI0013C2B22E|nr:hypothetical protein [Euzebya tangerina]
MTQLRELLRDAAEEPRTAIDPLALRDRVRTRTRRTWAAAVVGVVTLLAVPFFLIERPSDSDVLLDQPTSRATPQSIEGPALPSGAVQPLEVDVQATVLGALADQVSTRVEAIPGALHPSVGYPVDLYYDVVLSNSTNRDLIFEADGFESDSVGSLTSDWHVGPTGLNARISLESPRFVVASEGERVPTGPVAATDVPVGMARGMVLQLRAQSFGPDQTSSTVAVPMGDSQIQITLTTEAGPVPDRSPSVDAADLMGEEVPVPAVGEANGLLLGEDHPVWVSNTESAGVVVVDARSAFSPNGITVLTRWCPSAQGYFEEWGGSRFTPDGTYSFGPAVVGLTVYPTEAISSGDHRVTGSAPGQAPRAQPFIEDEDGQLRYPFEAAELEMSSQPPLDDGFAGPFCDNSDVSGTSSPEFPSTQLELDGIPRTDADQVPDDARVVVDEATLVLDPNGNGFLCAGRLEAGACAGREMPADLPHQFIDDPERADDVGAYTGEFILTTQDGVIVDAWVDDFLSPDYEAAGSAPPSETGPTFDVVRFRGAVDAPADLAACRDLQPACDTVVLLEILSLRTATAILTAERGTAGERWNGDLPDGWVIIDESFGQTDSYQRRGVESSVFDGVRMGDIVIARSEQGVLTEVVRVEP